MVREHGERWREERDVSAGEETEADANGGDGTTVVQAEHAKDDCGTAERGECDHVEDADAPREEARDNTSDHG